MDYTYKANNNKLLNESSFTIEEFCYDNDIEDPRTFIRILRQLCDFDDIEQADNSLLRKALVKYQQTLKESSDYIYKAKIGDKLYLQGNSQDGWDTTSDPDEAAIFESKTEPTQIINQMKKDGKIHKNDKITVLSESISDFKGHLLFGTAVLGIGTLTAIDRNKAKLTADKLGIELAETEYGPHKAAGLVGPIYEYKYGMKGPMNIDSLCEYLKNHTDYDEITYEDEGDNYVINYTDNYAIHQTAANATVTKHRTSKGNLNLPKEYFDVSFVLDESTKEIKTLYGKMQVVDEFVIQDDDKLAFVQKAREKYNELDKDGWFDLRSNEPYWYAFPYNRAKFTLCVSKSLGKVCFIDYRKEGEDKLYEKRIELPNSYPVKKDEIIDLIEHSGRLINTATDSKTIQIYIYSNGSDRPEALAEVEITSTGYILHGTEGYDYQGNSLKEFEDDLRDVVFNFDATTSKRFGESTVNKKPSLKEYFFYVPPRPEDDEEDSIIGYIAAVRDYQTQKTKYVDDDGNVCNSKSQAKVFDTKGKADYYSDEHCPEGWTHFVVALKKSDTLNESNVTIAPWKRERAERLIEEANKIDPSYSFVEYDIGPKKEIKYKIFKNDDEYVGTFDVFTDEPYNSPYRYFFHHVNVGGLEFQGMTIDEFNKDFNEFIELDERVGHKALNEARVFSHSSGFGLSGHYDYEAPEEEPLFIATETNEDDGELYFDETGCTTEFKTNAKKFTSEEDALEFAKSNVIFGEPGAKLYEKSEENTIYKEENTMKKLFENGNLFDYVLNESSSALKETVSSLEWLLDKAYVSEYRMVGKNSAEVRVRHTPELLTSDSMAARFDEDIPDGYKLEVDFLGEDPVLGRNFDIYEVQLVKD